MIDGAKIKIKARRVYTVLVLLAMLVQAKSNRREDKRTELTNSTTSPPPSLPASLPACCLPACSYADWSVCYIEMATFCFGGGEKTCMPSMYVAIPSCSRFITPLKKKKKSKVQQRGRFCVATPRCCPSDGQDIIICFGRIAGGLEFRVA